MKQFILVLNLAFLTACSDPEIVTPQYQITDVGVLPVAKVGEEVITKLELDHTLAFYSSNPVSEVSTATTKTLEQMVEDQVMVNKAIESGFDKSAEYLVNQRKLLAYEYRKFLQKKVETTVKVTVEDARRYYKSNIDKYSAPSMYRIAIVKNQNSKMSDAELIAQAKKLGIGSGFGELASYSQHHSTKNKKGLLPWVSSNSRLPGIPVEVLQKLADMKEGEIKSLTVGDDKYLIRMVSVRESEVKPFEALSHQLQSELLEKEKQELLARFIEQEKDSMKIEYFEKNIALKELDEPQALTPPGFPVR